MILRLSQKLNTKIKAGKLNALPLDENPYSDWSCHLFTIDRIQYILLTNTASFYSCVMYGNGITDDSRFIERALSTIREFMEADGQASLYQKFIAPSSETISFAKALNRRVIGTVNELVIVATYSIRSGEMAPSEVGFNLNGLLFTAIGSGKNNDYGRPKDVFKRLMTGQDGLE